MPRDPVGEAHTLQWVIAALNSIEMVTVPWWFLKISDQEDNALATRPATEAYIMRATDRAAFKKAYADQMAHVPDE